MKRLVLLLMVVTAVAEERPQIVSFGRHGNRFLFQLREGAAEMEMVLVEGV